MDFPDLDNTHFVTKESDSITLFTNIKKIGNSIEYLVEDYLDVEIDRYSPLEIWYLLPRKAEEMYDRFNKFSSFLKTDVVENIPVLRNKGSGEIYEIFNIDDDNKSFSKLLEWLNINTKMNSALLINLQNNLNEHLRTIGRLHRDLPVVDMSSAGVAIFAKGKELYSTPFYGFNQLINSKLYRHPLFRP